MDTDMRVVVGGVVGIVCLLAWAIVVTRRNRFKAAGKRGAGLVLMSAMMFGFGLMNEHGPQQIQNVRNNTDEKKAETEGASDETV